MRISAVLSSVWAACFLVSGAVKAEASRVTSITPQSSYQIVIPAEYPENKGLERFLKEMGDTVKEAFAESMGLKMDVVKEDKRDASKKAIFLGATQAIKAQGVDVKSFDFFDGVILEKDGDLFIAGRDKERFDSSKASSSYRTYSLGTVKVAVHFLEKYLDTRFVLPGKAGIDYAPVAKVDIPQGLREDVKAPLIYGAGRTSGMLYDYSNNNMGAGSFFTYGGHSFYDACPAKVYAKEHPEYFALIAGKRSGDGGHLCISNPDVQELIYKEALKRLDAGATVVQVAQTDGYQPCQCEKCRAYGNTDDEGEKIWILERNLAERLLKDRPGKYMHFLCYPPNSHAPKSFKSFPDNVIIEMCRYTQEAFDEWKDIKVKNGFTVYIYNWGWYQPVGITPKTTPEFVARQARHFCNNHVKGIYRCGFGELFGLEGPVYYVYGKMLDDPSQNFIDLADEYYRRAFGAAYAPMASFFNNLYRRIHQLYILPREGSAGYSGKDVSFPDNRLVTLGAIYTPALLNSLEMSLSRAEKLADTEKVRIRLSLIRKEFGYLKNLGAVIAAYNMYLTEPTQENFKVLAKYINERNALMASYRNPKGGMLPVPGMEAVAFLGGIGKAHLEVNGRLSAPVGAPLTWNVNKLLEKGVLPGKAQKTMTVEKADGQIGEDPEAGAWSKAPWQELEGAQLNESWCTCRFKMLYDNDNLYFAVDTNMKADAPIVNLGKDGAFWNQDCVEIMLDPEASHQRYYHFAYNPLGGSYYDGRFGYLTDPLHPKYHDTDATWDGKWTYSTKKNGEKWTSFFTVPFATLGNKPVPGSQWCLNVGREAHYNFRFDGAGRPSSELTLLLWSPNMESVSLQNPEAFGNLIFK